MLIKIDRNKVVTTCISNGWYKRGCCRDYEQMLDMCNWHINQTEENIKNIATDIFEHSTGFDLEISDDEHILNIAFILLNHCCSFFLI